MKKFLEIWNSKYLFIPRALAWLTLCGVVPVILINQKFVLWSTNEGQVDFNAWGVIAIIIFAVLTYALIGYCVKAFEYNFIIQLFDGFRKCIVWLIVAYFACVAINNNVEKIQYILQWSMLSCSCGIVVNPFPRWAYKMKYKKAKEEMGL